MKNIGISLILFLAGLVLIGCDKSPRQSENTSDGEKPSLVIYSGITMVKPLQKLANEFAAKEHIDVTIKQGASGYLYKTLKTEKRGDIYFPGSDYYRKHYTSDHLLTERVFVGFNRLALIVAKNNPKALTANLKQLTHPDLSIVLASPDSSAVGKTSEKLLLEAGIRDQVFDNVSYFTTDSHRLSSSIRKQHADLIINWYATTQWPENRNDIDAIMLPDDISQKKRLELNLLSFARHPEIAKKFMRYVSSAHGLQTFSDFGFLTEQELQAVLKNPQAFSEQ